MDQFNGTYPVALPIQGHDTLLRYFSSSSNASSVTALHGLVSSKVVNVLLLLVAVWVTYTLFVRPRLSPHRHLPSPNQGFVLFRLLHEPKGSELERWMETIPHDGLIRYYGLWNEERLFAASPAAVTDLLVKQPYNYIKPRLQFVLADNVTSKGLLIVEGDDHKAARKAFNPAFSTERIRRAYPTMLRSAAEAVDEIKAQIQKSSPVKPAGQAAILKPVSASAIDIIGQWGFSRQFKASEKGKTFVRAYLGLFKTTVRGQWTLDAAAKIGAELALKLPLRAVRTMRSVMVLVRQTSEKIVAEHEQDSSSRDDMLTTAMKAGHFTHTELVQHTVHFLAASTETVSGSIAWTIHILSRHPDMQERLREEIRSAFGSHAALVRNDPSPVLERLPYLNAVINEVLRFHSINSILWRESVSAAATIRGHGVPVGTKVTFSPWALGRNPRLWGVDAKEFNPDRWVKDPTSGGAHQDYAFLTFGVGPRRCIGETYARAEMRCMIASLVGAFDWAPIEELRGEKGSDVGREIGDDHALTLFKILEGWRIQCTVVPGWC